MSQQGDADPQDWWHKLYEDPPGAVEPGAAEPPPYEGPPAPAGLPDPPERPDRPDPRVTLVPGPRAAADDDAADTLESRFGSAWAMLTGAETPAGPDPRAGVPDPRSADGAPAPEPAPGAEPAPEARTDPEPKPVWAPEPATAATGYALGQVAVPPVVADAGPERPAVRHLGDRPPTYAAEPGALPVADPAALDALIPDTVLEGARYGGSVLRAGSVRGDSARYRGEARRDFLLTARFGTGDDSLVLVAVAGGDRAAEGAREAAAELCRWVGAAVGRSQGRLGDDLRAGRRDALRSGLQRLTDRGYGRLRARAAELGIEEPEYTAGLRCLLLPIDPECHIRVSFGTGPGGLFRLRAGDWQDLEAGAPAAEDGSGTGFRFRASLARPGDTLLLCTAGLAEPMREEALLSAELAARWAGAEPPGLAAFLADTQLRLKGYADDRTAAALWEA
ncbi:protein phosphatase 2C domain-containing protein [Streptomyces sp. NPDC002054]|uniref:protein phosphatase 2C domain-containing protein n=1 Tax=Streptomyces sp. NPDC002054 TaxID=3154663 RepID=UPI00331EBA41